MKNIFNLNTVYIIAVIIALGSLLIPKGIELYNLQVQGISYVANDVEKYHNNAHPVEGEYAVTIDLSDLASNEGKVLFDDGENKIYLSEVIVHSEAEYEFFFRSRGRYSLGGASLVSGVTHTYYNGGFNSSLQAEVKASYKGETHELSPSGSSGLNYRDGDEFGFYLDFTDDIILDLKEEVMVDVTVTNLFVNLWAKKTR
ncbi:hypothetical protein GMD78_19320 [Ornithinibacillus sp. L9]|uniref:Uncharacterized protein n=1 Tax=Ornithinibacillus caprae TaxID=2678566 RepID=A0A6N8FMU3_9BACI|nr:hypothetical protein [Ornithinibacillus caprae]